MTRRKIPQTALLRYLGARCEDCGTAENLTVDHKVPLNLEGKNDETNIRILCRRCQNRRHGIDKKKRDYR
jgi:5-methylcytosine-specific restriction endonuclease McrA